MVSLKESIAFSYGLTTWGPDVQTPEPIESSSHLNQDTVEAEKELCRGRGSVMGGRMDKRGRKQQI